MPLALDPKLTFEIVLDSDKFKEKPPTFTYRYLNGREWRRVGQIQDQLEKAGGADQVVDLVLEAASVGLIGWSGMIEPSTGAEIPFDLESLDLVVGMREANELIVKMMEQLPSIADKKKLD